MYKIVLAVGEAIVALEIQKNMENNGYLVPFIVRSREELLDAI